MLDGTEYFECDCGSVEHTLRFVLDTREGELHTEIYLRQWHPWWKRVWLAVRYVFGYRSQHGHWDSWMLKREDAPRLRALLDKLELK